MGLLKSVIADARPAATRPDSGPGSGKAAIADGPVGAMGAGGLQNSAPARQEVQSGATGAAPARFSTAASGGLDAGPRLTGDTPASLKPAMDDTVGADSRSGGPEAASRREPEFPGRNPGPDLPMEATALPADESRTPMLPRQPTTRLVNADHPGTHSETGIEPLLTDTARELDDAVAGFDQPAAIAPQPADAGRENDDGRTDSGGRYIAELQTEPPTTGVPGQAEAARQSGRDMLVAAPLTTGIIADPGGSDTRSNEAPRKPKTVADAEWPQPARGKVAAFSAENSEYDGPASADRGQQGAALPEPAAPEPRQAQAAHAGATSAEKTAVASEAAAKAAAIHEPRIAAVNDTEAEMLARGLALKREHEQLLGEIRADTHAAALQARSLPVEPAPRRGASPATSPAVIDVPPTPEVRIGQIDVFVESSRRPRGGATPTRPRVALASRQYLRRL